jgi:hypothetical protein
MSFLFSLIPFIFITYYMIMLRKTKYVTMDLRNGEMCYCCKDKIEIFYFLRDMISLLNIYCYWLLMIYRHRLMSIKKP